MVQNKTNTLLSAYGAIKTAAAKAAGKQLDHLVYDYEGKQISLPRNGVEEPSLDYVRWQRKEIFKGQ